MPRKFRVEITPSAERDVRSIQAFIARDKKKAAAPWVREFTRQVRSLESMPLRYEVIPEAPDLGVEYRHIIFGNYRTIYRVQENRVIILRVIHAARLLDQALFQNLPPP
ncbi:MAG: type II toxin-antitoxin system RelE/ParE family toxin [Planctomycetes bacterium]|nr:type II toxin-antitoxin system RelE/ParE family toxin [Planctomycetota bacterium]